MHESSWVRLNSSFFSHHIEPNVLIHYSTFPFQPLESVFAHAHDVVRVLGLILQQSCV